MSNPSNHIFLSGEQGEVFDEQMQTDREAFESTDECVIFRPEIDGEWLEYTVLGGEPPFIEIYDLETEETINTALDWVCVVDVGRATGKTKEPSGCRMRIRCPMPTSPILAEQIKSNAIDMASSAYGYLAKKEKSKGFG